MLTPSPAVRAVLIGLVVITLTIFGATGLHLHALETQAETHLVRELQGRSSALAAALAVRGDDVDAQRAFGPIAAADWPYALALVNGRAQVISTTDDDVTSGIQWNRMIADGSMSRQVFVGREGFLVALHPIGGTQYYVANVAPASAAAPSPEAVWEAAVWAAALWGLFLGCLVMMGWYAGPYTATRMERLGARIAQGDANPEVLIRHARFGLGQMAGVFVPMAHAMTKAWASVAQSREHVRALYQVNPHYVLLCSLDGRIIEANPAFYAVTGLSLEALKAGPVEVLDDIFPIGPLQDMARRSLKEACSIGGIEYGIIGQDDEPRAVQVSLRAFSLDGEDVVIIQATDVSVRRTMEQRIHAFTDTLDLMVDRRVAQLTAGQKSIRRVLDGAGLVLASFDGAGATRRWSGGARALTGKSVGQLPSFSAVTNALNLSEAEQFALTTWFWGDDDAPLVARHEMTDDEGEPWTRRFVWHKSHALDRGDLRTIVGLELPALPGQRVPVQRTTVAAAPTAPAASPTDIADEADETVVTEPATESAGDGYAGMDPLPDSAFARQPRS